MSVEVTQAIGERLPDLLPDPESFEANRASTEASIVGFAQILADGADPVGERASGPRPSPTRRRARSAASRSRR